MMFLGGLLTLVGLGALGYFLGWRPDDLRRAGPSGKSRALEILDERYARGEITREQYQGMREELER